MHALVKDMDREEKNLRSLELNDLFPSSLYILAMINSSFLRDDITEKKRNVKKTSNPNEREFGRFLKEKQAWWEYVEHNTKGADFPGILPAISVHLINRKW